MSRRIEALQLELKKAKTLMMEVDKMLENGIYNSSVHSLYYACYHATKALLLTKDLVTKTHKGIEIILQQQFVHPGLFDKSKASFFKTLMHKRADSDYGDVLMISDEEIKPLIQPAKDYMQYVTKMVEDYLAK